MDGVGGLTQEPVAPGASFEYRLTPPDPGTFLIRPCVIGASAEPLGRGLSAILVVEEPEPPAVDADLALLIDDWRLEADGSLAPFIPGSGLPAGRLGNALTVSGTPIPEKLQFPAGSRVRLRLANACNARAMRLRFDGLKPFVIAVDSQPTETFEPLRASFPLGPGNRVDVMIDLPEAAGAVGRVVALVGEGVAILELGTSGPTVPARQPIGPLPRNGALPAGIRLQNASRHDVGIAGDPRTPGPARWSVNGRPGSIADAPLARVRRGTPVVLALRNETPLMQPLHLHGHAVRLLHPFDDGWEPYFLDTVQVPENRTVRIAFLADNPGRWLLASMVMERFDAGLWTWIEVT
jgi:FtsP/CotA-like multicopper oxidase with cupredoxin domain